MQRALRKIVTGSHSRGNIPQITVKPGEIFEAETELCTGDWLESIDTVWSREKENGSNPTVVVAVDGAKPGDSIIARIRDIIPDSVGYTGFTDDEYILANRIIKYDWGTNVRIVRIEDGYVHFSPSTKLPVSPMIGTFGTAPAGAPVSNTHGGPHGGNMDAQQIKKGAAVTLPVEVPGALLHLGDVHAIQGDGEICGSGGIECRSLVTLSVDIVPRSAHNRCVRVENEYELCAVACGDDFEDCCLTATGELIHWICDDYGMGVREAYLLLGQILVMNVTQLVNPTRTIAASVPKKYLPRAGAV